MHRSSAATQRSFSRLLSAEPVLTAIAPLADLVADLPERTLFHAGPPFGEEAPTVPIARAAAAAAIHEGWAETMDAAGDMIVRGDIRLIPAQDVGLVTPLAFVVGPSMVCLKVEDANGAASPRLSPLNDGPLPDALRMGTGREAGIAMVREITDGIGAELSRALLAPVPLLPVLAGALGEGDDLHGRVEAAQTRVATFFDDSLDPAAGAYLVRANQFVLNAIMAAASLMIGAGAGEEESDMIVAVGGNGRMLGYKLAGAPQDWVMQPALPPQGPRMPGMEAKIPLPAIGDSAVIDALGFGAACLRYAPSLADGLKGHVDAAFFTPAAHEAFIGPHPALPQDVRLGLDLTRTRACLGIMLAILDADGEVGLIGRGIAPWPAG